MPMPKGNIDPMKLYLNQFNVSPVGLQDTCVRQHARTNSKVVVVLLRYKNSRYIMYNCSISPKYQYGPGRMRSSGWGRMLITMASCAKMVPALNRKTPFNDQSIKIKAMNPSNMSLNSLR